MLGLRIALGTLFIILVSALHIATVTIFPYPFNTVNITIIALVFLLLTGRTKLSIIITIIMGVVVELYAVTPFGALLAALLASLMVGIFMASHIITTLSFLGGVALTFGMVVCYRLFFVMLFSIYALRDETITLSITQALGSIASETIATTFVGALFIGIYTIRNQRASARIKTRRYDALR